MISINNARGELDLSPFDDAAIAALSEDNQQLLVDLIEVAEETTASEADVVAATDAVQALMKVLSEHEAVLLKLQPKITPTDGIKDHLNAHTRAKLIRYGLWDAVEVFDKKHPARDAAPNTVAIKAKVDKANHELELARAGLRAATERMKIARRRKELALELWHKANPVDDLAMRRAAAATFKPQPVSSSRMPDGYLSKLRAQRVKRVRGDFRR